MAAVILQKLAGQLRAPADDDADGARRRSSPTSARASATPRRPPCVGALDDLAADGDPAAWRARRRARCTPHAPELGADRFDDALAVVRGGLRARLDRDAHVRDVTATDADLEPRIAASLAARLAGGADVTLHDVQRIAVGWSHETWLFDATWHAGGAEVRRGLLPAPRPRQRAAARDVGPRHAVPGPAVPRRHRGPGAAAVLLRGRRRRARRAVPRDGEGAGHVPEPVGSRRAALLRRGRGARRPAGELHRRPDRRPHARLGGRRARRSSACRQPGTDFARREIATWRAAHRRVRCRRRSGADRRAVLAGGSTPRRPTASRSSTAPTARATC